MTKLYINLPTVDLEAQGSAFTVTPADFAAIALEGILTYGIRRWFQDHINSAAHTFKRAAEDAAAKGETFNDGKPFDVAACFAARLEQAKTGELRIRTEGGPTFTPEQDAAYEIVAHADTRKAVPALAKAWAACKGMTSPERKTAMLSALEAMPPAFRDHVAAKAADRVATAAALRAFLA